MVVAFLDKIDSVRNVISSDYERADLLTRLIRILQTDVNAAYDRLLTVLREDFSNAKTDHGVWKLPQGDLYYQLCLEFHTTTKMSAEEIHSMGLKHVERIQNEMRTSVEFLLRISNFQFQIRSFVEF